MCPSLGDTNLSIASIYNARYPGECVFYFRVCFSISTSRSHSILFLRLRWPASLSGRGRTQTWTMNTLTITMCYQTSFQKFLLWRKSRSINTRPLRPEADNYMQHTGDGFYKLWPLIGQRDAEMAAGWSSLWDRNYVWLFHIENHCSKKLIVATMINCE